MSNPLAFLDRMLLATFPRPTPHTAVRAHLQRLGYSSVAIVDILCTIESTGSARGSESLDTEDAAGVEALLAGPEGCHDGCRECADEASFRQRLLRPSGAPKRPDDSDLANVEAF